MLEQFQIDATTLWPEKECSWKPHTLLFDEMYDENYEFEQALQRIEAAKRIIFIGTSFSVGITHMAYLNAVERGIPIEIVDLAPEMGFKYNKITYHICTAEEYIHKVTN